jgi:hypothetical protein
MPRADPERWRALRIAYESDPDLSLSDVAMQLGVAVPTVSLRAKRELWMKGDVVQLERLDTYDPHRATEIAFRALVRAANQTYDMASAVKAAGMILDRTLGKVAAEQTTPLLAPGDVPDPRALPTPDWYDPNSRLRYQAEEPTTGADNLPYGSLSS